MCWFSGPTTESVFVTVNKHCAIQHLADLVLSDQLRPSEIDPECRSEVEELVIARLMKESAEIAEAHRQIVESMWTIPPEEWQRRCKG